MWLTQGSPLSPVWSDLKTNSSSGGVQSLTEEHFLSPQRAFPEALCLSPTQWMLSLFPPSWQMPVLQNKDDISAVVLGLRKGIILGSAGREAAHKGGCVTPLFVPQQGGPWRPWPRPNTRPVCGETCARTRGGIPGQLPGPVAHLCQLPPKPSSLCLSTQRGSWAEDEELAMLAQPGRPETGTGRLFCRILKNRGFVLSLWRIMSLSPGTHWTAHLPKMQSG